MTVNEFWPQVGAVYVGYDDVLYEVIAIARRLGGGEHMVVYQAQEGTMHWVCPVSEFGEKFSYVSNVGWEPS